MNNTDTDTNTNTNTDTYTHTFGLKQDEKGLCRISKIRLLDGIPVTEYDEKYLLIGETEIMGWSTHGGFAGCGYQGPVYGLAKAYKHPLNRTEVLLPESKSLLWHPHTYSKVYY